MIYRALSRLLIISALAVSANATTYFVAPNGDDSKSGLSELEAWASVDQGESLGIIRAGDTVWVLSGSYFRSTTINLTQGGTASKPILYARRGINPAIVDFGNIPQDGIIITKSHYELRGLTITNVRRDGIRVVGNNYVITECVVRNVGQSGIDVFGAGALLLRNLVHSTGGSGIKIESDIPSALVYGNTIHNTAGDGITLGLKETLVFNNIIASCNRGIFGVVGSVCAFNLLWRNKIGDYSGGVADSAGGISKDPLFVDTTTGDFRLGFGSPAIDAGLDIAYAFTGVAPDMGAYETREFERIEILPVRDTLCADSTYQFKAVGYDSSNNPAGAGALTWTHTFATGSISPTGLFIPSGVGGGMISVTSNQNGVTVTTGPMYVRQGALVAMTVVPDSLTIPAGDFQLFSVSGVDKHANAVADFGSIAWSGARDIGFIDSTGLFTALKIGADIITAQSSLGVKASSDTIRVMPGRFARLDVLPSTNVVPTLQSYQYLALGYDSLSNYITDYTDSVAWSTTDLVGSVTLTGKYTAGLVDSYWVMAALHGVRDSGAVDVVVSGGLDHIQIEFFDGTAVGATALTTDVDTTLLFARGYAFTNALIGDVPVAWSVIGGDSTGALTPTIGAKTELSLRRPGVISIAAVHFGGLADSAGAITVSTGVAASLQIVPDTATIQAADTLRFSTVARDADNNFADPQPIPVWDVSGGIGAVAGNGLFTAQYSGLGHLIGTAGGIIDSSGAINVVAGPLKRIRVIPDSVAVGIGDTVLFTAIGLDSAGNTTDPGVISWKALGRIGAIDSTGKYIATAPGVGAVSVSNQLTGIADTTASLRVEELYFTTIPLGNGVIHPAGDETAVAEFRIDNYFASAKTITSVSVRDLSTGAGTANELAGNMATARIYFDRDNDSALTETDSLLAETAYTSGVMTFAIPPVDIPADSGVTFIVAATSALSARDGDTVDVALIPVVDIATADLTVVAGPFLSNSLGITQIDGLVAEQITVDSIGSHIVRVADSLQLCMTIELPRNGYAVDTLNTFTIANTGTASESDFDSLVLFADSGNNQWNGSAAEVSLGRMVFNGESWSRGGLTLLLNDTTTRLFLAAKLNRFPRDGATITMGIPMDGVRMSSGNDGPIDKSISSPDTLTIEGQQALVATAIPVSARSCVPGQNTGPLLALRIMNGYPQAVAIDSIKFDYASVDPQGASAAQLEAQVDSVYLYLDRDADASAISAADSLIAVEQIRSGKVSFDVGALSIAGSGGIRNIIVSAQLALLACKNGNTIAFTLPDSSAVVFDRAVELSGAFPIQNPAPFTINAFPAAAVVTHTLSTDNLYGGQIDRPVLDFELPRNGYAADNLVELDLVSFGAFSEEQALDNVRLWKDLTRNGFSADDAIIGEFKFVGGGWRLEDIRAPLDSSLNRFVVTVSVSSGQFDGGTVRFDLPVFGALTASGMAGPDNAGVTNPSAFLVFPSNRVTAISIPIASTPVYPGSTENALMTFALYNGYTGQTKTLNRMTLTNTSLSIGSTDFADHELGQISLFWDVNKNRILDNDQLIGTGLFAGGRLRFDGFTVVLPPESLAYFFVVADLPKDLIDGDSLSASIEQSGDFSFSDFVNLNGDLPLSSGGHLIANGSARCQYELFGPAGRSLSPGDTGVVLLAFTPAYNGDQQDLLNDIVANNLGTADATSLLGLKLWRDVNVNGALDVGDSSLSSFSYSAGTWSVAALSLPVTSAAPHLMVVGDISLSAQSNATIRIGVPQLGCNYQSANDGPIDSSLVSSGLFTVSTSGLKVALGPIRSSYSVGETIHATLSITNVTGGPIDSVYGVIDEIVDSTLVRLDSSAYGPVNLAVGEVFTCNYYYTAIDAGNEVWKFRATSRTPVDSSIIIQTPATMLQRTISPVALQLLNTSPNAVTKGQTNIFPMTIGCAHPDTDMTIASMSLQSIRLRVVDGQGSAIPANSVFSRMVIATGFEILSVVTNVPTQSEVLFPFNNAVTIQPNAAQNFMLIVDIAPSASAADFSIEIDSAAWIPLSDANTGQVIPTAPSMTYPLTTAPTRVDAPSQQIAVSAISNALPTINYGQQDASVLKMLLRHSGQPGSSSALVTQLSLAVIDSIGGLTSADDLFSRVTLWRQNFLIGAVIPSPQDSTQLNIPLSTPLNLNAQEIDSITLAVSVKNSATTSGFSIKITDSSWFTVRDLNTGSTLLAVSDTTLASGNAFPIVSDWSAFRIPAEPASFCLSDIAPSSVARGADSVRLLALTVNYSASPQHSSVHLTQAHVQVVDGSGGSIDPDQLFDRVGIRVGNGAVQYNQSMTIIGGGLRVLLADTGLTMLAGDSVDIELVGDLRVEAPYSSFAVRISGLSDFDSYDISDPNHAVGAVAAPGCNQSYPFSSATTSILLPAGRPLASRSILPMQMASPGNQQVVIFEGTLSYDSPSPLGQIEIQGLRARLARHGASMNSPDPISASVSRMQLEIGGVVMGSDSTLSGDTLDILALSPFTVSRGETVPIRVTCDLTQNATPGNVVMTFTDSSFLTIVDKSLLIPVYPILSGSAYPAAAGEISIVAGDLKASFTNYPNPFNPARGEITTIGFILTENARVDIDMFTITGESVYRVANHSYRLAGAHQSDTWSGVNGTGLEVVPGVYFCRITATHDSGRVETIRRKIAVVR